MAYRVVVLHQHAATPAIFLPLCMFVTAVLALMSGLLAEIIVRVLYQVGGRLPYTIAEHIGLDDTDRSRAR